MSEYPHILLSEYRQPDGKAVLVPVKDLIKRIEKLERKINELQEV